MKKTALKLLVATSITFLLQHAVANSTGLKVSPLDNALLCDGWRDSLSLYSYMGSDDIKPINKKLVRQFNSDYKSKITNQKNIDEDESGDISAIYRYTPKMPSTTLISKIEVAGSYGYGVSASTFFKNGINVQDIKSFIETRDKVKFKVYTQKDFKDATLLADRSQAPGLPETTITKIKKTLNENYLGLYRYQHDKQIQELNLLEVKQPPVKDDVQGGYTDTGLTNYIALIQFKNNSYVLECGNGQFFN